MNYRLVPAIVTFMLGLSTVGHADATIDTIDQYVTFSGFGTLGLVHSDYSHADFIGNVVQPRGAGYSSSWSPTPDSDLGGQANFTLTDALSAVVQVLSRDDANGNFKPDVEWVSEDNLLGLLRRHIVPGQVENVRIVPIEERVVHAPSTFLASLIIVATS